MKIDLDDSTDWDKRKRVPVDFEFFFSVARDELKKLWKKLAAGFAKKVKENFFEI